MSKVKITNFVNVANKILTEAIVVSNPMDFGGVKIENKSIESKNESVNSKLGAINPFLYDESEFSVGETVWIECENVTENGETFVTPKSATSSFDHVDLKILTEKEKNKLV